MKGGTDPEPRNLHSFERHETNDPRQNMLWRKKFIFKKTRVEEDRERGDVRKMVNK